MEPQFKDIQVGDKLIRMLGGVLPIYVIVTKIDSETITCCHPPKDYGEVRTSVQKVSERLNIPLSEEDLEDAPTWTFSINNGAELDPMLGWTEQFTGSYLIKPEKI